jgi:guanylate kinase
MKILFILWDSGSGKSTLEKHLVDNYGFRMFDKLSSRPTRNDDSGYMYFPAKEITDMYVDWMVQECIKYDGNIYAMRIPSDARDDDCFVAVMVPSWYHQFIDMGIEDNNEVYSIFLTNDSCAEWMKNRWDSNESIQRRLHLNKKLRKFSGWFEQIESSQWVELVTNIISLLYPNLIWENLSWVISQKNTKI